MTATGEFDLRSGGAVPVGGGSVSAFRAGVMLTAPSGGTIRLHVPGLGRSDFAGYWTDGQRLLLVGLRDGSLVLADPESRFLAEIGALDRLTEMSVAGDSGCREGVRFVEVSRERVAVVFERGVALVDPGARSVAWQRTHSEADATFCGLDDGAVWLTCDDGRFGFRIEDGAFVAG